MDVRPAGARDTRDKGLTRGNDEGCKGRIDHRDQALLLNSGSRADRFGAAPQSHKELSGHVRSTLNQEVLYPPKIDQVHGSCIESKKANRKRGPDKEG
jgi:hypothetical protein